MKPYPEYKDSGLDWLGMIPSHWEVQRMKYVVQETDLRSEMNAKRTRRTPDAKKETVVSLIRELIWTHCIAPLSLKDRLQLAQASEQSGAVK